ncbi:hypothetical protein C8R47DRAFT_1320128 [Mycena vitilis]|nr:hypothetical protein C8R47DRAFT_1320128 [Mycena vitilis]
MPARVSSSATARASAPHIDDRLFFYNTPTVIICTYYDLQCKHPAHAKYLYPPYPVYRNL